MKSIRITQQKNDQKIPKEIRITHPPKINDEQHNNTTNYTIKYKHNPNKKMWYPVPHHQGVWTYNQIKYNFNINSWKQIEQHIRKVI